MKSVNNLVAIASTAVALSVVSGCTTFNADLNNTPLSRGQARGLYEMASKNETPQISSYQDGTFSEAEVLGRSYSSLPQRSLEFNLVTPGTNYSFSINTTFPGWLNQGDNQRAIRTLERIIPNNSYNSFVSLGDADASSRKGRRSQPSELDFSSAGEFGSSKGAAGFSVKARQKRVFADNLCQLTFDFNSDQYNLNKRISGAGETVYSGITVVGAGLLAGLVPGAAIASGVELIEAGHASLTAKRLPAVSQFSSEVAYPVQNGNSSAIHNLFNLTRSGDNVYFLQSSNGLGFVAAKGVNHFGTDSDGVLHVTTSWSEGSWKALGNALLKVAPYAAARIYRDMNPREINGGGGRADNPSVGSGGGGRTVDPGVE